MAWLRPQHRVIADALGAMDPEWLLQQRCFFGGGTAVVMRHGEYRQSLDVDFLCADQDGYRRLREAAHARGPAAFFGQGVEIVRELRSDRYGIRGVVAWGGQPIKFEVVREDRIALSGHIDQLLRVPTLSIEDQVAEKLLANADRWADPAAACRDAFDLGALVIGLGHIPELSKSKAERAYGQTIGDSVRNVLARLSNPTIRNALAVSMQMDPGFADRATSNLHDAAVRAWPKLDYSLVQLPGLAG